MVETTTVRVYESDKERLKEMADARGGKPADVIAHILREPVHRCPECGEPFESEEIDPQTVEEHGVFTTGVDTLVRGEREVKNFECPCCEVRIRPQDLDTIEAEKLKSVTREDIDVSPQEDEGEFSTEEA